MQQDETNVPSSAGPVPLNEPVATSGSFRMPSDYYSQPHPAPSGEKRGCPKWVPMTCGVGGCLTLLVIFAGGFFAARIMGTPKGTLWFVNRVEKELRGMMTPEVTEAQRVDFDRESAVLRGRVTRGEVSLLQLSEWLEVTRSAMGDRRLTPEEVTRLVETLRKANALPARRPQARIEPLPGHLRICSS